MSELAVLFMVGALASATAWRFGAAMFESPVLQRRNFRGIDVPVAAGVVLVAAVIAVEAVLVTLEVQWRHAEPRELLARSTTLLVIAGFGMLGAFDDVAAHGEDRGFKGHLRAIRRGRLSTGGLKLVGGGLLAVVVVAATGTSSLLDLALGSVLIALAANLGNLFDRAPGRTTKVGLLMGIVLVAVTPAVERPLLSGAVLVLGAAAGLLRADLGERLMLGDAGSNVIGAALGLALVLSVGRIAQAVVLLVLLALNLISERVSFSGVINSFGPLRALDRFGRRP